MYCRYAPAISAVPPDIHPFITRALRLGVACTTCYPIYMYCTCRTPPDSGPTPTVGECGAEATLTGPRLAVRGDAECGGAGSRVA